MAVSIRIYGPRVEFKDSQGVTRSAGKRLDELPTIISAATGAIHDQEHSVATTATVKLFDIADDLADFDFLFVIADQVGNIQLANNAAATFFTMQMLADLPFILGGDNSEHTGTIGAFDGTSDPIERVYFENTSANTALVRVVAIT